MKMTKKALTAMIAVSIAATALPAAAMVSNISNTLTSSNSTGANSAILQAAPAAAPEGGSQTAAPAVQAEPSPESMFEVENVDDNSVAIIGVSIAKGETADIVIPQTIGGKEVVSLKNNNSRWNSCMTGADQITSIDTSLCSSISIGDYVFNKCDKLTSVNLPNCTSVGHGAFGTCNGLTSVDLPNCTSVAQGAFFRCSELTSVDLSNCETIRQWGFSGCSGITKVKWSSKMDTIPLGCFEGCTNLKTFGRDSNTEGEFDLSGITSIGSQAFKGCSSITGAINFSDVTSIAQSAFSGCSGITSVDLSKCDTVGNYAFSQCSGITSVDLSNCTTVGNFAFQYCSGITSVTWPTTSMKTIPQACFANCTSLKYFNSKIEGQLNLDGISTIGTSAFQNCPGITSIVFPTEAYTISDSAFHSCSGLTSVDLTKCSSIGKAAFYQCTNLQPIISTDTASVGQTAFQESAAYVTIQANTEEELINYCAGISADSDKLMGLSDVKKVAKIPGVTDTAGLSYDIADVANLAQDASATYYLTTSASGFIQTDYQTPAAYDITLKSIENGTSAATEIEGNISLTIEIPTEQYDPERNYYFAVDGNVLKTNLPPAETTTSFTSEVSLSVNEGKKDTTVTLVSPNVTSIDVTGDDTLTYGASSPTYTATVKPDDAKQAVTWSSTNEDVLKFEDPTNGTATIVGVGVTTIKATATDGTDTYFKSFVTVNPGQMGIQVEDINAQYDGQPHSISVTGQPDGATIQHYEGNYEDVDDPATITWVDENPAFTDVCNNTVSYKVTDPNGNYNEFKGTATINIS